ncbi:MAG: hypothetical protein A2Y33_03985 [Spirochaetes bacterium GWF1_51_8]|nr:MAG: hypothetical protein A2Y33_03985 [Spirochaetes bacterium GWF1_51_8]
MEILEIILIGILIGITPGPVLTMAFSQTLIHNRREGILLLVASVFSDFPIAAASILILSTLSYSEIILIVISFVGAVFIIYLGIRNIFPKKRNPEDNAQSAKPYSLRKGGIANLLNPAVYIFWMTVGGKGFLDMWNKGVVYGLLFLASFYVFNLGSAVAVIFLADRFRGLLASKGYIWTLRILGIGLIYFAGKMVYDAVLMIAK